jgi:hypothetical protein
LRLGGKAASLCSHRAYVSGQGRWTGVLIASILQMQREETRSVERAGTNACTAFHPQQYARANLADAAGLELMGWYPEAAVDSRQDVVILRKFA